MVVLGGGAVSYERGIPVNSEAQTRYTGSDGGPCAGCIAGALSPLNPQTSNLNPHPSTLNPQPSTLNPQLSTLNPVKQLMKRECTLKPSVLDPQPHNPRQARTRQSTDRPRAACAGPGPTLPRPPPPPPPRDTRNPELPCSEATVATSSATRNPEPETLNPKPESAGTYSAAPGGISSTT